MKPSQGIEIKTRSIVVLLLMALIAQALPSSADPLRHARFGNSDMVDDQDLDRVIEMLYENELQETKKNPMNYVSDDLDIGEVLRMIDSWSGTNTVQSSVSDGAKEEPNSNGDDFLEEDCAICLERVARNSAQPLDCTHTMHKHCALMWSINDKTDIENRLKSVNCPVCRRSSKLVV